MKTIRYLCALAAAIALAVAAVYGFSAHKRQSAELAVLRHDMTSLSAALQDEIVSRDSVASAELGRALAARWAPSSGPSSPGASGKDNRLSEAPVAAAADNARKGDGGARMVQPADLRDRYEDAFATDLPDPQWTVRGRQDANRRLAAALPDGSVVKSFECRSVLCRLETSHPDVEHYNQFLSDAFLRLSPQLWNGAFFSTSLDGVESVGPRTMVTYVAREGRTLPRPAE